MECRRETVAARVTRRPLLPAAVVDIAVQFADALEMAHAKASHTRHQTPPTDKVTSRASEVLDRRCE
jgi:hypothetical protein